MTALHTLALALVLAPAALVGAAEPSLGVHLSPPLGEIVPLRHVVFLDFWVNVSCLSTPPSAAGDALEMAVAAPAWADVSAQPLQFHYDASRCVDGFASFPGQVTVRTTRDAPAHRAGTLKLTAAATTLGERVTGNASVPLVPGYFGQLEARAERTVGTLGPGGVVTFAVLVTNHGNADTLMRLTPGSLPNALAMDSVPDLLLSRNETGAANVTLRVRPLAEPPDRDSVLTVRVAGIDASGGARGDEATLSFVVHAAATRTPALGLAPLVVALACLAIARRVRA